MTRKSHTTEQIYVEKRKAFTLIELLIVVSIIIILATIVLVSVTKPREAAIVAAYKMEMQSVRTGMELCVGSGSGTIAGGVRAVGDAICVPSNSTTFPQIQRCPAVYSVNPGTVAANDWSVTTNITCGGCRLICNVNGCAVGAEATPGACVM